MNGWDYLNRKEMLEKLSRTEAERLLYEWTTMGGIDLPMFKRLLEEVAKKSNRSMK